MRIRREIVPHILAVFIAELALTSLFWLAGWSTGIFIPVSGLVFLLLTGYLIWFFRDPDRIPPETGNLIVSAADGVVTSIRTFPEAEFRSICLGSGLSEPVIGRMAEFSGKPVIRISVFLSLMDVHVNRAPMGGLSEFLGYFPGKHHFTMSEKSSEVNQHNAIRIANDSTGCLLFQIVGPVARRVVYWPDSQRQVSVVQGERIGMMKFGSRLDLYMPAHDIEILATVNQRVVAGVTPLARVKNIRS